MAGRDGTLPLTELQAQILGVVARTRAPDSYLAGGAALHFAPNSVRYSNDLDFFHDSVERVATAFGADARLLEDAVAPLFDELYQSVSSGNEARIVIETCSADDYRDRLEKELAELADEEIWRAGKQVRSLRPEASGT